MWPARGLTGGNSQSRKDLLRLSARRVRRCAQMIREAASGERDLVSVLSALTAIGPCSQCVDAVLRLAEYRGFEIGAAAGLELAKWAREFIDSGIPEKQFPGNRLRAETLSAYYLRHTDIDDAVTNWRTAMRGASEEISLRERADACRRGAYILAEAGDLEEARRHVREARRLHKLADRTLQRIHDAERYLGAINVAEMFVEVSAIYYGRPADLRTAARAGRRLLEQTDPKETPRTWLCGTINFLAVAVCGWRLELDVLSPEEVAGKTEELLESHIRPQNVLSVYLRWLWCLAIGEREGLSRRVRRRLDGVRGALVADGRCFEAVRVLLDAAWIDAYRGRYRPRQESWSQGAAELLRLGSRAGIEDEILSDWSQACAEGWISAELAETVFRELRGLPPGLRYRSITLY